MKKHLIATTALAGLLAFSTNAAYATTNLTLLSDNSPDLVAGLEALAKAFEAEHPDIHIDVNQRPAGGEGDNLIKTQLATGEMDDIFMYNSGSLFQALNPQKTLVDLSDLPAQANVLDSFKKVVTSGGKVYGVPYSTAMGGGILYNRKIYKQLGLSVPKTWAEFLSNNEKIKTEGKIAVAQTYRDTWTSQLLVLGDFYNVQAAAPNFAVDYTDNKAKFATTPAALRGFEHLAEVNKAGYLNPDYGAATYDDGLRMVATGEAAHYPMLTVAIGAIKQNYPENLNDVGFFAEPGDDASTNGLTVWMPPGLYVPVNSQHQEEAKMFLNFVASIKGCDIQTATNGAQGPYLVKGCTLPQEVPPAVADLLPYFQTDGKTAPALEFLSPIKGPSLEQITVQVGSGIGTAKEGAALYDQDVEKQAKHLGLPNW